MLAHLKILLHVKMLIVTYASSISVGISDLITNLFKMPLNKYAILTIQST